MIIPIGHDRTIRGWPWLTLSIIALCTLLQIYSSVATPSERQLSAELDRIADTMQPDNEEEVESAVEHLLNKIPVYRWGYRTGSGLTLGLITSAFFHQGWLHLIGNMLFLWLAGSALEDKWGRVKFGLFYLVGAVAATYAFEATYTGPPTILVGASGAISACMGAFLVYFARTEITLWYFMMYRSGTFRLAAYVALPLWLVDQVIMSQLEGGIGVASVAYAAHIGGFLFGAAAALFAKRIAADDVPSATDDDSSAELPRATAMPRDESRLQQCRAALAKQDLGATRQLASRVMIDLGREGDHAEVLDVYRAVLAAKFRTIPLTDGAFVAATAAAEAQRDLSLFTDIAAAMRMEHPGSALVPKVLWKQAELQGRAGREDDETATLTLLAEKYPRHEAGARAAKELAKRHV